MIQTTNFPGQAARPQSGAVSISLDGSSVIVSTPIQAINDALNCIPSREWLSKKRQWAFPLTGTACEAIRQALQGARLAEEPPLFSAMVRAAQNRRAFYSGGKLPVTDFSFLKTPLRAHQAIAANAMRYSDAVYLNHDMGTGKTLSTIAACEMAKPLMSVLVGCPKAVGQNWVDQWATHAPCRRIVIDATDGSPTQRLTMAMDAAASGKPFALVINYESVWRGGLGEWILSRKWDLAVCDEVHRVKAPKSKQGVFFGHVSRNAIRRAGLSGTPMPSGPMDLWGQCRFVDPGLFHSYYGAFERRYGIMGGFEGRQVVNFRDLDRLNAEFALIAHTVKSEDVLELPETEHIKVPVSLPPKALAVYKALEDSIIAEIELAASAGTVTMDNVLVELLRLQQATSGHVKLDGADVAQSFHDAKESAIRQILEDMPESEPVVVFCRFTPDVEAVKRAADGLGGCLELTGRQNQLAEWKAGGARVLAANIRAGSVGVDMTRARYCVFYSIGFSLGDYLQALKRTHRQGQSRKCFYHHLVVGKSVDEKVYEALQKKEDLARAVLGRKICI